MEPISPFAPRPVRQPLMFQRWQFLTFLHWPYEPQIIRQFLPKQLTLDTWDGSAWIGMTPFFLSNLRPPLLPAMPWISHFPETNLRTYVRGPDGERGIWFFTLEAARLAAVIGARVLYRLPYRWARMRVHRAGVRVEYRSARKWPFRAARTKIVCEPGERVQPGDFENFLTARYRLYTAAHGHLFFAQIEHEPWPLHSGRVIELEQNLIEVSGLPPPRCEPIVHYSRDLLVRIGRLKLT